MMFSWVAFPTSRPSGAVIVHTMVTRWRAPLGASTRTTPCRMWVATSVSSVVAMPAALAAAFIARVNAKLPSPVAPVTAAISTLAACGAPGGTASGSTRTMAAKGLAAALPTERMMRGSPYSHCHQVPSTPWL